MDTIINVLSGGVHEGEINMSNENEKITKEELLKKLDEVGLEDHALDMVAGGGSMDKVNACIDHLVNNLGLKKHEAVKQCLPSRSS